MNTAVRSKLSQMNNIEKEQFVPVKAETIEMTLNTENSLASGLLIQRLTELYEDPVEASVRETISNAFDAVTEAYSGDRPEVRISTPTSLNPILVIKDNGVGMSYEDLKNIYSKYGASTKIDNLDTIGAYGLGAKSPLAYGTEFTVSSVKDGHKVTIIVAREELTNYIKIINNVKTDEPSGTTVSIPVNSKDIDRFNTHINRYENTPIDKDIDLYINGKLVSNDEYTLLTENVLLMDGKEKVYGRMWVKKDNFTTLITSMSEDDIKRNLKFLIGGWTYQSPTGRNSYRTNNEKTMIVELKAGLVGFNSSRDAILENDRYHALEKLVVKYVMSDEFMKDITKSINALDLEDFKRNIYKLFDSQRRWARIEDNKVVVENNSSNRYYYSIIPRKFKFEDFVHNETGFNLNNLLKNIPSKKLPTVVIRESKDNFGKTSRNAIMNKSINSSYGSFTEASIKDINETIDEIMNNKENSHTLDVLVLNLASMAYNKSTQNTKVTFITEIDGFVDKIKPIRKTIIRMRNDNDMETSYSSVIVLTSHTEKEIKKTIDGLGFDVFDLEIKSAEQMIEDVKKFRAKHRNAGKTREVNEKLTTAFRKYDFERNYARIVDEDSVDDNKKNIIVLSKSYITDQSLWEIHAWYCNKNKLNPDDVDIYSSVGIHRVIDLNILSELGEVYRDPYSSAVGVSKLYKEEFHDNVAKMNAFRESDITSEKALIRLLAGIHGYSPSSLARLLENKLSEVYEIAKIADFELPKFPTETINKIGSYDKINRDNRKWRISTDSMKDLVRKINKKDYDLLSNISLFATERTIFISDKGEVNVKYTGCYQGISIEEVEIGYNNKSSKQHNRLIKAKTIAELEFFSDLIENLSKLDI